MTEVNRSERDLLLFLPLHSAVLEPDLDLPLGETKDPGDLHPPTSVEVLTRVELLLQLQSLETTVTRSRSFHIHGNTHGTWKNGAKASITFEKVRKGAISSVVIYIEYHRHIIGLIKPDTSMTVNVQ